MGNLREILTRCADAINKNKPCLALAILDEAMRSIQGPTWYGVPLAVGVRVRMRDPVGYGISTESWPVVKIDNEKQMVLLSAPLPSKPDRVVWCPMDRIILPVERVDGDTKAG